jgi:chromosome segregation ATPase
MKYLFTILLSIITLIGFSNTDSTNVEYYLEKASKIDTSNTQLLYFNDSLPQMMVFDSNKVRVLFTMEELASMNEKLQMIPLLEEVIEKYGAETEIEVGVISSMENEIYVLKQTVEDKNGRIKDLNSKVDQMVILIQELREEVEKNDEIKEEYKTQIKSLEEDLRKQKIKTAAVAIGEGVVIVLLLLVLL